MKILLARTAGFCLGVRRATDMAVEAVRAGRSPVATLGPLVHNRQAVELLEARGIRTAPEGELPGEGAVIIRAHGVSPAERSALETRQVEVIDATCPHVLHSQRRIAKASAAGHEIVLLGDRDHPEVLALEAHATSPVHVISTVEEARAVAPAGSVAVLAQTTFHKQLFDEIVAVLRERFPGCTVYDSICTATEERQQEARRLAEQADVVVVVGGKHSANTRRLAEVGRETGTPTFHVETAPELDPAHFRDARTVAVTAGASTPGWLTQQVIDRLESFGGADLFSRLRSAARVAAHARLSTAVGAAALTHAVGQLLTGAPPAAESLLLVAGFVFVAYTCNRREPPEENTRFLLPVDRFYREHRRLLLACAGAALLGSLVLAAFVGPAAVSLMSFAYAGAVLYAFPLLPARFSHRRLKDLPASKDLLVAAAWAVVLVGAVSVAESATPDWDRMVGAGAVVFLLVFAKTVMLDLRDIESDHLIGLETFPILIGYGRAVRMLYAVHLGLCGLAIALGLVVFESGFGMAFALVPLYGAAALPLLTRSQFRGEAHCQLVIDGQLFLAGGLSLAWEALA